MEDEAILVWGCSDERCLPNGSTTISVMPVAGPLLHGKDYVALPVPQLARKLSLLFLFTFNLVLTFCSACVYTTIASFTSLSLASRPPRSSLFSLGHIHCQFQPSTAAR
jgi:hypothetical protein